MDRFLRIKPPSFGRRAQRAEFEGTFEPSQDEGDDMSRSRPVAGATDKNSSARKPISHFESMTEPTALEKRTRSVHWESTNHVPCEVDNGQPNFYNRPTHIGTASVPDSEWFRKDVDHEKPGRSSGGTAFSHTTAHSRDIADAAESCFNDTNRPLNIDHAIGESRQSPQPILLRDLASVEEQRALVNQRVASRIAKAASEDFRRTDSFKSIMSFDFADESLNRGPSRASSAHKFLSINSAAGANKAMDELSHHVRMNIIKEHDEGLVDEPVQNEEYEANPSEQQVKEEDPVDQEVEDVVEVPTGEEAEDANEIEGCTQAQIDAEVFVKTTEAKGRCLHTRRARQPGSVIFVEDPVLVAVPSLNPELWKTLHKVNSETELALPPVWHLAAIYSLTSLPFDKQAIIRNKWVPDPDKEPSKDVRRVMRALGSKWKLDGKDYERFLNAWRFNSFGHHTEDEGLVLYNNISMMAHSCANTACWHYGKSSTFVLRARQCLAEGDEITISYIGDDELFKSTHLRREKLSAWLFKCLCVRCEASTDCSRGFLCGSCGVGTFFLKTDDDTSQINEAGEAEYTITTATPCNVCRMVLSSEEINEYVEYEAAYIERLDTTTAEDIEDVHAVFSEACNIFRQHWILYTLDCLLSDGYKAAGRLEETKFHLERRLAFLPQICPQASFTLAWLHEELGDVIAAQISPHFHDESCPPTLTLTKHMRRQLTSAYGDAHNFLCILCSDSHHYSLNAWTKLNRTFALPSSPT